MKGKMKKNRKRLTGIVVSDRMDKSVVVKVERVFQHPRYKKTVRRHRKYKAHNGKNECKVGDRVIIEESRPISKEKRWRVVEKIESRK